MFCDAIDVIFIDSPHRVIDIFESFNCEALFMSTHSTDGYNCMPDVKQFVDKVNGGNGRYLNSGVYIGKTEFIKEVNAQEKMRKLAISHCNGLNKDTYAFWSENEDFGARNRNGDLFIKGKNFGIVQDWDFKALSSRYRYYCATSSNEAFKYLKKDD